MNSKYLRSVYKGDDEHQRCRIWILMDLHRLFFLANWNIGRGRKSAFSGDDVLFMLLSTLKHGVPWDFLGKMFKIKGPSFERTIVNFLRVIFGSLFDENVLWRSEVFPMARMVQDGHTFQTHRYARYGNDVNFQHTY